MHKEICIAWRTVPSKQQGPVHPSDEHRHGVGHGGPGPTKEHDPGGQLPLHDRGEHSLLE